MSDDRVEAAVAQALDICKGDPMDALRMVLVANIFYEEEIRQLKASASTGFSRQQIKKKA
jgi:hypothetical protein